MMTDRNYCLGLIAKQRPVKVPKERKLVKHSFINKQIHKESIYKEDITRVVTLLTRVNDEWPFHFHESKLMKFMNRLVS